ncbi:unnamed protein product [Lasius platythorax]|uniref:Uncharacterized protein n=1 Tax=Lasius platythorax TaxID=488582 RepID=A0AAV2NUC8_9HYME
MELREVSRAYGTAEEMTELLPQRDSNAEYESYFIEYAMQKEMINRNRCPASRRLLSQAAHLDYNFSNSNHKDSPCAGISMIHTSSENWPPSRKREEATALENLRKRVEQSKLYKTDRITDHPIVSSSSLSYEQTQQQLDNRPKLLKKVGGPKIVTI